MKTLCPASNTPEQASVIARIRQKKQDYEDYDFTKMQGRTLRAFFDLAQEYETLENFYRICVFVPKEFLGFDSCLYLIDDDSEKLQIVCDSLHGLTLCGTAPPEGIEIKEKPYELGDSFVAPIRGNKRLIGRKPISMAEDIIGMFEVFPLSSFGHRDKLFFEKYANRIGYNLHYKLIALQNEEHLKFITNLISDIEHNVIVPNMRYSLFLRNLKKEIDSLGEFANQMKSILQQIDNENCSQLDKIANINHSLEQLYEHLINQHHEMVTHYRNTSLFLESLLRRDHFEKGQLVLKRRLCRFKKEIIDPQLERYRERLLRQGCVIDEVSGGIPDEEDIPLAVDVGLISQVYANFFSNAEKYCREVTDDNGNRVKFLTYGREILKDYFGPGKDGIKFNVFTTGPNLSMEEAERVFDEGYRADRDSNLPGTGHGLHFVKKIIEVHGGVVGCEPTPLGNNFYFILPIKAPINDDIHQDQHK